MGATCLHCGVPANGYLCQQHAGDLERVVGDLPGLIADVAASATRQTAVYRTSSRRREPDQDWRGASNALASTSLPVDLDATRLLRRAHDLLVSWCRHLAHRHHLPLTLSIGRHIAGPTCATHVHDFRAADPDAGRPRPGCGLLRDDDGTFACKQLHCRHQTCAHIRAKLPVGHATALARWLLLHFDAIERDDAASELTTALTDLRDELQRCVDRSPSRIYAGPCHAQIDRDRVEVRGGTEYRWRERGRCERLLYARVPLFDRAWILEQVTRGREVLVTCDGWSPDGRQQDDGCGTEHNLADRDAWMIAAVEDALLPIDTLRSALPGLFPTLRWPTRSTWSRWVSGGRLVAKTVVSGDVELYRGGDVVDLVRREQTRIIANANKTQRTA